MGTTRPAHDHVATTRSATWPTTRTCLNPRGRCVARRGSGQGPHHSGCPEQIPPAAEGVPERSGITDCPCRTRARSSDLHAPVTCTRRDQRKLELRLERTRRVLHPGGYHACGAVRERDEDDRHEQPPQRQPRPDQLRETGVADDVRLLGASEEVLPGGRAVRIRRRRPSRAMTATNANEAGSAGSGEPRQRPAEPDRRSTECSGACRSQVVEEDGEGLSARTMRLARRRPSRRRSRTCRWRSRRRAPAGRTGRRVVSSSAVKANRTTAPGQRPSRSG